MGNWGNWCCHDKCPSHSDDFNRVNLGANWTEVSGNWSVASNQLTDDGTAGGAVIYAQEDFGTPFHAIVSGKLPSLTNGAKYRVIVNYLDASNYFFAEYEHGSPAALRLYRRGGGTNVLLLEKTSYPGAVNGDLLEACFTNESFAAHLSSGTGADWLWICNPSVHANGKYAGLGNGAAVVVVFDDFTFTKHRPPTICPLCQCLCEQECIPWTLTLTMTLDDPTKCTPIDGATVTLTYNFADKNWKGSVTLCGYAWDFTFWCGNHPTLADEHVLTIPNGDCVFNYLDQPKNEVASTCSPLSLVFPTAGVAYNELIGILCTCCYTGSEVGESAIVTFTITE